MDGGRGCSVVIQNNSMKSLSCVFHVLMHLSVCMEAWRGQIGTSGKYKPPPSNAILHSFVHPARE